MKYLTYVGNGASLHDVPQRDLSKEEADRFGVDNLVSSGLYKLTEQPKPFVSKKTSNEEKGD